MVVLKPEFLFNILIYILIPKSYEKQVFNISIKNLQKQKFILIFFLFYNYARWEEGKKINFDVLNKCDWKFKKKKILLNSKVKC